MNTDLLHQVLSDVLEIGASGRKTVFSISTTAKQEEEAYLTPIRVSESFVLAGCIIFDQKNLFALLEGIDGKIDIVLADSERPIPLCVSDHNENVKQKTAREDSRVISKICFDHVKESKIFEFKPSDLTVNAAWSFISQRLGSLIGKKVAILGAGNIGSKLALKLAESGAEVRLFRRNVQKGSAITFGLNKIKSNNTTLDIQFHSDPMQASNESDVLIGASNGHQIINKAIVSSVREGCLIVDLGKNNLSADAISSAKQESIEVCRTDITPAIESHVCEILKMQEMLQYSYGKRDLGFCAIVGGGFFGDLGDIVVDNIQRPSQIFGVSQGNGLLKHQLNAKDGLRVEKLRKKISAKDWPEKPLDDC